MLSQNASLDIITMPLVDRRVWKSHRNLVHALASDLMDRSRTYNRGDELTESDKHKYTEKIVVCTSIFANVVPEVFSKEGKKILTKVYGDENTQSILACNWMGYNNVLTSIPVDEIKGHPLCLGELARLAFTSNHFDSRTRVLATGNNNFMQFNRAGDINLKARVTLDRYAEIKDTTFLWLNATIEGVSYKKLCDVLGGGWISKENLIEMAEDGHSPMSGLSRALVAGGEKIQWVTKQALTREMRALADQYPTKAAGPKGAESMVHVDYIDSYGFDSQSDPDEIFHKGIECEFDRYLKGEPVVFTKVFENLSKPTQYLSTAVRNVA